MVGWNTMIKNLIKKLMARIEHRPIPKDDKAAALEAISAYKAQNPVKYEQKKEALFARYGLDSVKDSVEVPDDANDIELKELKKKVSKKAPKKVTNDKE